MKTTTILNINMLNESAELYEIIENIEINNSCIKDRTLAGAKLLKVNFNSVTFDHVNFFGSKILSCNFKACKFVECNFDFTSISDSTFEGVSLSQNRWVCSTVRNSKFSRSILDKTTAALLDNDGNECNTCFLISADLPLARSP